MSHDNSTIWKPVVGYEGFYEVSNTGLVRSLDRHTGGRWNLHTLKKGRTLKAFEQRNGYYTVALHKDKRQTSFGVHRVVAVAFILNPQSKPTVNHKDGDKSNNCTDNLEWATHQENHTHAKEHDLKVFGERHHKAKLTEQKVRHIRSIYASGKMNQRELGELFGVDRTMIGYIIRRKCWVRVTN